MDVQSIFSILASLFVIEILLSIDNALVNATIASEIKDEKKRNRALRIGIALGAIMRVAALLFVSLIISNPWIRALGGAYLVFLALKHLGTEVNEKGHTVKSGMTYGQAIFQIALADLVFSIDNVITAVSFSHNISIVIAGVMVGVVSMMFITPILSNTIRKYPGLSDAAYVIVGFIGACLLLETYTTIHIGETLKFLFVTIIISITMLYETNVKVQTLCRPIFKKLRLIAAIPFDFVLHPTIREAKAVYKRLTK